MILVAMIAVHSLLIAVGRQAVYAPTPTTSTSLILAILVYILSTGTLRRSA